MATSAQRANGKMSIKIQTNTQAQMTMRHLGYAREMEQSALEKLGSGSRINKAADDAAGLAISENIKALSRSLRQDVRNAQDGVSFIQVAEGAMNEASNIFIRIRELSIYAASDTIGDVERGFLDKEVQNLNQELRRISEVTEFNGTKLMNNLPKILEFQVGPRNNPDEDRLFYDVLVASLSPERLELGNVSVATKESARGNLAEIDGAFRNLMEGRAALGALQNRMQSTMENLRVYNENLSTANSRIRDTDMAEQTAELTKASILSKSGLAVLGQANQSGTIALKLLSG
jgi:flagellin